MTQPTCEEQIDGHLERKRAAFRSYMNEPDTYENGSEADGLSSFHDYGLSFDACIDEDPEKAATDYYRYQLSWGGPSDEIRFHRDGSIEYRFMDWFDGAGRIVTGEDWAQWLRDFFTDVGMIDFDRDTTY